MLDTRGVAYTLRAMDDSKDPASEVEHPRSRQTAILNDRSQIQLQRCKLVHVSGARAGKEHELSRRRVTVGASEECDIMIADPPVSGEHFVIVRDEQSYLLQDLGSTNGTFLDNSRIKEAYLRPGVVVRAGDAFFRFEPVYERIELVPAETPEFGDLLGTSYRMREIFTVLGKVAPTEATILLQGETGTGKGAVARAIHKQSKRSDGPFVVFDCGAVAPNLVESELFGHERGAFTGAVQQRRGAFEQAHGGTLFIDELAELTLELQPKLLRALEEREFSRVGSHKPLRVDCRIIAASQRDLWDEVAAGRFREDLYFRLAVVTVPLPALRERQEDIPMLVDRFLAELDKDGYENFEVLDPELQQKLLAYEWPGNLRELRNTAERIALMEGADPFVRRPRSLEREADAKTLNGDTLAADYSLRFKDAKEQLVGAFEREYLTRLLSRTGSNIAKAAREAGIDRKYLYTLLAKHDLTSND